MSKPPTRFEIADAKDVMSLEEELEHENAGVRRRSTNNEEKVARRVEAERCGDWRRVAETDRCHEQLRVQKHRERQELLARKRQAAAAFKNCKCDPASNSER